MLYQKVHSEASLEGSQYVRVFVAVHVLKLCRGNVDIFVKKLMYVLPTTLAYHVGCSNIIT